jgi:hypothetical protein
VNIISYDIEITKNKKVEGEILELIETCFVKSYKADISDRIVIEKTWDSLPYQDFKTVFSSTDLLCSFTIENVQVFLFKKVTNGIISINDLSITVFSISEKEINLILKSSYSKLLKIFDENVSLNVIEGTQVNIYPFDTDKNDVVSPTFYLKAEYNLDLIYLDTKDWIKLILFVVITCIFIVMYFTAPANIIDDATKEKIPNNVKELYSALMSLGLGFVVIEIITKLLVPKLFKKKYPVAIIKNFSNLFENRRKPETKKSSKPIDPITEQ